MTSAAAPTADAAAGSSSRGSPSPGRSSPSSRTRAASSTTPGWRASTRRRGPRRYLLQQINRHVFHHPEEVMENMARVTRPRRRAPRARGRARRRIAGSCRSCRRARAPPTTSTPPGETWRLVPWIEGTRSDRARRHRGRGARDGPRVRPLPGPARGTCPARRSTRRSSPSTTRRRALAAFERSGGRRPGRRAPPAAARDRGAPRPPAAGLGPRRARGARRDPGAPHPQRRQDRQRPLRRRRPARRSASSTSTR